MRLVQLLGLLLWASTGRAEEPARDPVILSLGLDSFVPIEAHGSVEGIGIGLASELQEGSIIGLRLAISMDPIDSPQGPEAERAWAAIVEGRQMIGLGRQADFFVGAAGGFVMGDRDGEDVSNLVLPYARLGAGIRLLSRPSQTGSVLFISPELGVVPGAFYDQGPMSIVATYSAVQIGWILP